MFVFFSKIYKIDKNEIELRFHNLNILNHKSELRTDKFYHFKSKNRTILFLILFLDKTRHKLLAYHFIEINR